MQLLSKCECPWWGKIGLLWLILIPLCLAIYVLSQPLAPNDFWYHLRAGEWMVQHQSFPRVAMFTSSVRAGTPYFYQSWIAEILMYLTLKWSGLAGSQILRALCFTSAMAIFIIAAQKRAKVLLCKPGVDAFNDGARRVAFVGLFVLFMSVPNTDLRPQAFSLPLFAIFAAIIFSWANYEKHQLVFRTACLLVLMAIWANTHGAFATGLILLLLFCIGETTYFYFSKRLTTYFGDRLTKSQLGLAWIAFTGSAITACINPKGWQIYAYVYALTGNKIGEKYIQEWQPPTWSDGSNAVFFCCGIASLLMLILVLERFRNKSKECEDDGGNPQSTFGILGLRPGETLVIAAFFVMGLRNVRSIIWFAFIFLIAGTALLCRILPPKGKLSIEPVASSVQKINALLAVIICFLIIPFSPYLKPMLPWPNAYTKRFAITTSSQAPEEVRNAPTLMLAQNTPIAATIFLQNHPPKGLLWNDMVFGSYLVWVLDENRGPWADPRVEMRSTEFWETYLDTSRAKNNPSQSLPQRGFSDVLIDKDAPSESKLLRNLAHSSNWKNVYEDEISIIYTYKPQRSKSTNSP